VITIEVEGLDELQATLDKMDAVLSGDWDMSAIGEGLLRYATQISPVVTGSYRDAQMAAYTDKTVSLGINPSARNPNGAQVIDYAAAVENRHSVYERAFGQIDRFAVKMEGLLFKEMGLQ